MARWELGLRDLQRQPHDTLMSVKLVELVDQTQCPGEEVPLWFLDTVLIRATLQDVDRHLVHLGLRPVIRQECTSRSSSFVEVLSVITLMIHLTSSISNYQHM